MAHYTKQESIRRVDIGKIENGMITCDLIEEGWRKGIRNFTLSNGMIEMTDIGIDGWKWEGPFLVAVGFESWEFDVRSIKTWDAGALDEDEV